MGWWHHGRDGTSLHPQPTGLMWGDGPADIIDTAISEIREQFREEGGREPTAGELRAGLEFSLLGREDDTPMDSDEGHD